MTFKTSLVAVWYSRDSSRSRVRACNSPSNRAFSIAMTAWSAKVRISSICRSVNGSTRFRARVIVPSTAPSRSSGTPRHVRYPAATVSGRAKSRSARKSATCTTLPSSATRPARLSRPGTIVRWRKAAQNSGSAAPAELAAKPGGCFDHGVQHRLHIGGRAADDVEYVAGRGLVFQRFFEVARAGLQFAEQPRILDGDHRLVRK